MYTKEQIVKAMEICLMNNEREIISARFGLNDGIPRTLSDIQINFGVTREEVRAIEKKVLVYLQEG